MQLFKTKIDSARAKLNENGLDDPRLLGLVLLAFIGLSVLWNGVGIVQRNYDLQQKVSILVEENRILELENRNKELQNEYYETPEFAELKARRVNGKAAPGETAYIISEETALAALKTPEEGEIDVSDQIDEKPEYQQNFEAWIDFFLGG